jgi:hypothetical protein
MDHFESIISTLLEAEHYWVLRSFKVHLTKEDKQKVNKHTIPKPEIDLLAFNFSKNEVIAFEAKSFLDSQGVKLSELQKEYEIQEGKYKLFTSENYRKVVLEKLLENLIKHGMANSKTKIILGLAAGKVHQKQSGQVREFMQKKGWIFWSPEDIKRKIEALATPKSSYQNDPTIITAKILLR